MLQPVATDEKAWLIIDCVDTSKRLCQYEMPMKGNIPKEAIDAVLSKNVSVVNLSWKLSKKLQSP